MKKQYEMIGNKVITLNKPIKGGLYGGKRTRCAATLFNVNVPLNLEDLHVEEFEDVARVEEYAVAFKGYDNSCKVWRKAKNGKYSDVKNIPYYIIKMLFTELKDDIEELETNCAKGIPRLVTKDDNEEEKEEATFSDLCPFGELAESNTPIEEDEFDDTDDEDWDY